MSFNICRGTLGNVHCDKERRVARESFHRQPPLRRVLFLAKPEN
jgi:hypothetical protein